MARFKFKTISLAKSQLRSRLLKKQRRIRCGATSDFAGFSRAFVDAVYERLGLKERKRIFVYLDGPHELSVAPFIGALLNYGHCIYVPCWSNSKPDELLRYTPLLSIEDISSFRKVSGIPMPSIEGQEVEIPLPDAIFIPAVAYDYKGNRLGRGTGHFDRYLCSLRTRNPPISPLLIGVIPTEYYLFDELIPAEPHDIPIGYLLTGHEELIKIE